jgi:hypothetical protein
VYVFHQLAMCCHNPPSHEPPLASSDGSPRGTAHAGPSHASPCPHGATLLGYCIQLVSRNIPAMNTLQANQGAQNIAQGLTTLVSEQRFARQEDQTRRQADKNKIPSSFFRNNVLKPLRWCHIQDKELPPDILQQPANASKGQHRRVIQGAMDKTCEQLGFQNVNFQITKTMSNKVVGL